MFNNLLLGKMSHKAVKKQIKKKHNKKTLRKKLLKKLTESQQTMQATPVINQQQAILKQNTRGWPEANLKTQSIRAQLLAKAALMPGLGFYPQQYGNNTNSKSINNLQTDNEMLIRKINDDSLRIQALEKQKLEGTNELKNIKKRKDKLKSQIDDINAKLEINKDNESETKKLQNDLNIANNKLRLAEEREYQLEGEGSVLSVKKKIDKQKDKNLELKYTNMQDKYLIEQNTLYEELKRQKNEYETLKREREFNIAVIGSDEFNHPENYLKNQFKAIAKAKRQNELLKKQMELEEENNRQRALLAAQPSLKN